jgi:hypothetical protein
MNPEVGRYIGVIGKARSTALPQRRRIAEAAGDPRLPTAMCMQAGEAAVTDDVTRSLPRLANVLRIAQKNQKLLAAQHARLAKAKLELVCFAPGAQPHYFASVSGIHHQSRCRVPRDNGGNDE